MSYSELIGKLVQLGAHCLTWTMTVTTPATSAFAPVAPLDSNPRRLVLCFDDTADLFSQFTQILCYEAGLASAR
jgi:uncharacterized protein (DUF2235 family)